MMLFKFTYNGSNIKEEHNYQSNTNSKKVENDFNKFMKSIIANYICPFLTKEEITDEVVGYYKNQFKKECLKF